jgi:hypothetical protein
MAPFPPNQDLPGAPLLYAEAFWAKITAVGTGGSYSWVEMVPKAGGLEDVGELARSGIGEGLSGGPTNPAYEVRGRTNVPKSTVGNPVFVQMWLGRTAAAGGQQYLFDGAGVSLLRGKLDGAMVFGGSAVMSVWAWTGSAEADTGENVTVGDWLLSSGQTIAAGKNVVAGYVGGRWVVIGAQCP